MLNFLGKIVPSCLLLFSSLAFGMPPEEPKLCEVLLTKSNLENAKGPYHKEIRDILANVENFKLKMYWQDRYGMSALIEAMPYEQDVLPFVVIPPPPMEKKPAAYTSVVMQFEGNNGQFSGATMFKVQPSRDAKRQAYFVDVTSALWQPQREIPAELLKYYVAMSVAPYAQVLELTFQINSNQADGSSLERRRQAFELIRKAKAEGKSNEEILQALDIPVINFLTNNSRRLRYLKTRVTQFRGIRLGEAEEFSRDAYIVSVYFRTRDFLDYLLGHD
jgi:hypothetical protein